MVTNSVSIKNSQGQIIAALWDVLSDQRKHIVICVHGLGSSKLNASGTFMREALLQRNIDVLRIDLSGHGESYGTFADSTITQWGLDVTCAINWAKNEQKYDVIDIMGSSAGGMAVLATLRTQPAVRKVALRAPVSNYPAQRLEKNGQAYMDQWKSTGVEPTYKLAESHRGLLNYPFIVDAQKHVALTYAHELNYPILIIHGTADMSVPIHFSRELIKELPSATFVEIKDADHALKVNGDMSQSISLFADWFSS